ncbi:hypothetical protein OYE22_27310 [Streptomyces sp. 71268]|uniref:hypothetical protein n=1 Tax=Streptomyces sp. 71268 TaxID=3002640 RepID=UPI0023F6F204|nr:hypothetical protein [Streptomyces sp. 71268]WEV28480.1 hypothetical protein OYE22_27310 [Streptomyces sp. 71268]
MNIDWTALGQVFGVSLVVTVAMVGVFTLGIVGTSAKPSRETATGAAGATTASGPGALARSGAYACFALCAAAVAYGIYLIVA